jgi:hypothetical protein
MTEEDDRERLLLEEEEAARLDGGERDHDACLFQGFKPPDVLHTLWVHRDCGYGFIVDFPSYEYAKIFASRLLKRSGRPYKTAMQCVNGLLFPVGYTDRMHLFIYKGSGRPLTPFIKLKPAQVITYLYTNKIMCEPTAEKNIYRLSSLKVYHGPLGAE